MGHVVLVHGAWHGAWCWDAVLDELGHQGVTATAVELPFTGFADDVAEVRSAIGLEGSGVVVCAHSYGGVVASEAVMGLANVSHLVYISALVITAEPTLIFDSTVPLMGAIISEGPQISFNPSYAHDIFYGDSSEEAAAAAASRLRPMVMHPEAFMATERDQPDIPSTYVVCTKDRAISPDGQFAMANASQTVIEWPTDHSPFLTRPGDVADLLASVTSQA